MSAVKAYWGENLIYFSLKIFFVALIFLNTERLLIKKIAYKEKPVNFLVSFIHKLRLQKF